MVVLPMSSTSIQRLSRAIKAVTGNGDAGQVVELARKAGVDGRLGRRVAKGITINASAYLRLCAVIGLDPLTGETGTEGTVPRDLDWNRVAIKILLALIAGSSLRKLSKAWKVEYTAINRAKHQQPVNIDNFLKICRGLKMHPYDFLASKPEMFHGKQSLQQSDDQRVPA